MQQESVATELAVATAGSPSASHAPAGMTFVDLHASVHTEGHEVEAQRVRACRTLSILTWTYCVRGRWSCAPSLFAYDAVGGTESQNARGEVIGPRHNSWWTLGEARSSVMGSRFRVSEGFPANVAAKTQSPEDANRRIGPLGPGGIWVTRQPRPPIPSPSDEVPAGLSTTGESGRRRWCGRCRVDEAAASRSLAPPAFVTVNLRYPDVLISPRRAARLAQASRSGED